MLIACFYWGLVFISRAALGPYTYNRSTCYIFGKVRRTDFLPVGPDLKEEVFDRGYESLDTDEDEKDEYQWGMQATTYDMEDDVAELADPDGNELNDFM